MPDGNLGADPADGPVRVVLGLLPSELTPREAALLAELEALGREVARAKSEIAALQADDITASQIPAATDELDAVVAHTAAATNEILDSCEALEGLRPRLPEEAASVLSDAVTRIYEACSFQDITGQRIGKVVTALKTIERRVAAATHAFGCPGAGEAASPPRTEGEALASGPQLPASAASQQDIDRLLASFE
ncbi:protein phosphatase CheZ [Crenalkalicoccus roseus]|uniref:protein phosphatase CheZ n=1 Tax=Crenalkalicoccus roseus TaxID=1485588 RepID=UPI001080FE92|nr:protein phosphatase CheZ [Crenalkalicoccus roseus]